MSDENLSSVEHREHVRTIIPEVQDSRFDEVDADRLQAIEFLERRFPVDRSQITADNILSLSLVNSTLVITRDWYPEDREDVALLEEKEHRMVLKVCRLVALASLRDARQYPTMRMIDLLERGYTDSAGVSGVMKPLYDEDETHFYLTQTWDIEEGLPEYFPPMPDSILNKLQERLYQNLQTEEDLKVALKIASTTSRYLNWRNIADRCLSSAIF